VGPSSSSSLLLSSLLSPLVHLVSALIVADIQTRTRYGPYWYFDEPIPVLAILGHGGKALEEMYSRK
jgi:hypothetical protein